MRKEKNNNNQLNEPYIYIMVFFVTNTDLSTNLNSFTSPWLWLVDLVKQSKIIHKIS